MGLTIADAMKMHPLNQSAKVVAGAEKATNIITGVTIIESPDIVNWLSGGEMLLTSLSPSQLDAVSQKEFISNLVDKGVSVLVIKVHRYVQNIPIQIIEYADEFGLPIIELEGNVRYVDVMYPIMAELFNHQVVTLKYYKEVHDRFTSLALKGEKLEVIISSLEQLLRNPVAIFDKKFNCITSTNPLINSFKEVDNSSNPIKNDGKFSYYKQQITLEGFKNQVFSQIIVPIYGFNKQTSVYLTVVEINGPLEELDYLSLENAATVVCLEMVKRFAVGEVELRFRNELMDELISGSFDPQNIQERAGLIGWNLNKPYIVFLLEIDGLTQGLNSNKKTTDLIREVSLLISSTLHDYEPDYILGRKHNTFIILYPAPNTKQTDQKTVEVIKKAATAIITQLKKMLKKVPLAAGIGTTALDVKDISRSYHEALDAITFGKVIQKQETLMAYNDLGIFRILCKFTERESLKEYIPEPLLKILEHDHEKNSSLLKTLEVFLACNNNATKAAQNLFIHYKTILYRLERIQEISGINLENKEDRLQIELGLKILHLLGEIE